MKKTVEVKQWMSLWTIILLRALKNVPKSERVSEGIIGDRSQEIQIRKFVEYFVEDNLPVDNEGNVLVTEVVLPSGDKVSLEEFKNLINLGHNKMVQIVTSDPSDQSPFEGIDFKEPIYGSFYNALMGISTTSIGMKFKSTLLTDKV